MPTVLLVEDEASVGDPLAEALRREGYRTDHCHDAQSAISAAQEGSYDIVVLDLGLPDADGLTVCREIRRRQPTLPVLVLTARAGEVDVVVGLDAGADDYVTKPFRLAELLARIRALLRRSAPMPELAVGQVRVDVTGHRAWVADRPLELAVKEFDLLVLLARHPGSVVDRSQIVREVWDGAIAESSRSVDTHVSALRRKLIAEDRSGVELSTVRGVGFRLGTA